MSDTENLNTSQKTGSAASNNANNANKNNEIDLLDLFSVLWSYRKMIISVTAIAAVLVVVFAVISIVLPPDKSPLPNKYTPKAQMLIASNSSGMSSALSSSGLGSLASLAGVNIPSSASNSALASYLVYSNTTLDAIVDKFNLIEEYKIEKSPRANSREAVKKLLSANYDDDSGVFTVSYKATDPVFARDVVNFVVSILEDRFAAIGVDKNQLTKKNLEENIQTSYNTILDLQNQVQNLENSVANVYSSNGTPSIMTDMSLLKMELEVQQTIYAQLKAQYEGLKVSMASEQPVFQILEYAEVPDRKSEPSRGKLCVIVVFAAGFLSVFLAFLLNALKNIKNDPVAVAKFKGKKD